PRRLPQRSRRRRVPDRRLSRPAAGHSGRPPAYPAVSETGVNRSEAEPETSAAAPASRPERSPPRGGTEEGREKTAPHGPGAGGIAPRTAPGRRLGTPARRRGGVPSPPLRPRGASEARLRGADARTGRPGVPRPPSRRPSDARMPPPRRRPG